MYQSHDPAHDVLTTIEGRIFGFKDRSQMLRDEQIDKEREIRVGLLIGNVACAIGRIGTSLQSS